MVVFYCENTRSKKAVCQPQFASINISKAAPLQPIEGPFKVRRQPSSRIIIIRFVFFFEPSCTVDIIK